MTAKSYKILFRLLKSGILAATPFIVLWALVLNSAGNAAAAAAAAPYATTTEISQVTSKHPGGTFMVGFAVEVTVIVTDLEEPGTGSPTGFVDITSDNGGPSCLNVPISDSGNNEASAVCTLFFTSAANYTLSANFIANANWQASSDTDTANVTTLSLLASISAGRLHTCSVTTIGELKCWGLNTSFAGSTQTNITQASANGYQTCAIKTDGTIECWGDNNDITDNEPGGGFLEISSGKDHVCGIDTSYKLNCWGDPESLPLTTTVGLSTPTVDVVAVSAANTYDCAIKKSDSTLVCWGDTWTGMPTDVVIDVSVGDRHACAILSTNLVECWGPYPGVSFGSAQFDKVESGSDYACAQKSTGELVCAGANSPPMNSVTVYTAFDSGFLHTCVLTAGNFLDCQGNNTQGQAPRMTLAPATIPAYLAKDRPLSINFSLTGGDLPSVLSQSAGTLPTNVTLSGTELSGTPTNTGVYNFTLDADETFTSAPVPYPLQPHSIAFSTTVQDATTGIAVSASPGSTPAGSPVTVNINVSKTATPSLSGSVIVTGTTDTDVYEGGCTVTVDPSGTAQCTLFFPTAGTKNIIASYGGDLFYFGSPDDQTTVSITPLVIVPAVSAGDKFNCSHNSSGTLYCWGKNDSEQANPPAGIYNVVSAGYSHVCARYLTSYLNCWGWNGFNVANHPSYFNGYVAVSSGATHACGLRSWGAVYCWGNSASGRTSAPNKTFTKISAGKDHTCALESDGDASCWGVATNGRTTPSGGPFSEISSGGTFTCGIRLSDGSLSCWGLIASPPAGLGFTKLDAGDAHVCAISSTDTIVCWGSNSSGQATPPAGTFRSVSAGVDHTCAVRLDGFMVCWGSNSDGQAPVLNIQPASLPTIDIDVSWSQNLVVTGGRALTPVYLFSDLGGMPPGLDVDTNTGEIFGTPTQAGFYTYTIQVIEGNLNPGLVQNRTYTQTVRSAVEVNILALNPATPKVGEPVEVLVSVSEDPGGSMGALPSQTVAITADDGSNCNVVLAAGSGSCFLFFEVAGTKQITGTYSGDGLFIPGVTVTTTSVVVDEFSQSPKLDTRATRTIIHAADGSLTCLGAGCLTDSIFFRTTISGKYAAAGIGENFMCMIQMDGQVRCQENTDAPVVHAGQFASLSVGANHACAVDVDGAVTCWGENSSGQADPQAGPFIAVGAGQEHSCGVRNDNTLFCWGSVPGSPPAGTFDLVSAGANHTCAVTTAGALSCWGDDIYGQSSPATGGALFQAVDVGDWHTCGLKQDGRIACWGQPDDGRSSAPYGFFTALAAAADHNCALRSGPKLTCWGKNDDGEAPRIAVTPLVDTVHTVFESLSHGFYPTGGTKPYQASVTNGVLPPGLELDVSLSPAGVIMYGTPAVPALYPFVITWEDDATIPLVHQSPISLTITGADLQIEIQPAAPNEALYKTPFSFDYVITNNTLIAVPAISLTVTLPAGISDYSMSGVSGCVLETLALTCDIGTMAASTTQTLTVSGMVTADVGTVLTTTAQVYAQDLDWPEIMPADNEDGASVTVAYHSIIFSDPFDALPLNTNWSDGSVITSPNGIKYLGDFSNSDQLRLTLDDLPPHRRVHISFDLLVIGPWEGINDPAALWTFGEWGQPTFLATSFSNSALFNQVYPGMSPLGNYPWRTGATFFDILGYPGVTDTGYHFEFTLQHTDELLDLLFASQNLPTDAMWGLDNVQITLDWSVISVHLPTMSR